MTTFEPMAKIPTYHIGDPNTRSQLPLPEIKKRIKEIENLDLSTVSIDDIKELLSPIFKGYASLNPVFAAGFRLYRGVTYDQKPKFPSNISYPPKQYAAMNRASRLGHQCFYCSNDITPILFELQPKVGDTIAIGEWISIENLNLNRVGYTQTNFERLSSNRKPLILSNDEFDRHPYNSDVNKFVAEYLAKTFCQSIPIDKKILYNLTIAIAERHFSIPELDFKFDGIMYPAVKQRANTDNLALVSSVVDKKMRLNEVDWFRVSDIKDDGNYRGEIIDFANSLTDNGELAWQGSPPQYHYDINEEGPAYWQWDGKRKLKDRFGNIIEPD